MKKIIVIILLSGLFSCNLFNKDKEKDGDNPHEKINEWIEANMRYFYYWNSKIPSEPSRILAPDDFFYSLLYSGDRFSWIQENYMELLQSLQGVNKEAGYELKLYLESEATGHVIAQIIYVKPGSPAEIAGMKRGDLISKINGTQITRNNYSSLLSAAKEAHTVSYRRYNFDADTWEDKGDQSLTTVVYAENPNFMDTVYHIDGKKIGYYVYHLFSVGPGGGSAAYNIEMDQVFDKFKTEGIDELILDLRFNSGGAESATINFASLVGKGVNSNEVFVRREYNPDLEEEIINNPQLGITYLRRKFIDKEQNIGDALASSRVYILTSNRTASASELLINGLKPFMDVILIGDVTAGKNMGSFSLYDADDTENTWGMQPLVVKSYNKLDQSDYDIGFQPDVALLDNSLILLPFGDVEERMLSRALQEIGVTPPVVARRKLSGQRSLEGQTYYTLDRKPYAGKLFLDDETSEKLRVLMNQ